MRRQPPDKIVNVLHSSAPVDATGLFEKLRRRFQFRHARLHLGNGYGRIGEDCVDGFHDQFAAQDHQSVVNDSRIIRVGNGNAHLPDDFARIDLVLQKEGSKACFFFAVDNRPVDGGRPAILRQQGSVQVESAQAGHLPDDFGQHPEGDDDLQVGFQRSKHRDESFAFQLFGLQYLQSSGERISFDGARLKYAAVSPDRLVGHRNHPDDVISAFYQTAQALDGKIGSSHVNDSQRFLFHLFNLQKNRPTLADKRRRLPT